MMIKCINIMRVCVCARRLPFIHVIETVGNNMIVATCVAHMNCTIKINGFFEIFINVRISMPTAVAAAHALTHISANVNIFIMFWEQPANQPTVRPTVVISQNFILFPSSKKRKWTKIFKIVYTRISRLEMCANLTGPWMGKTVKRNTDFENRCTREWFCRFFIRENDNNLFYVIMLSIGFRGQPFIIINKKRLDGKGNSLTIHSG